MAKSKKSSGIGSIERALQATRKKISAIKAKKSEEKRKKKKEATLAKAKSELKRLSGSTGTRRRK